jgi:drug/metabolite transporter (DMT)-like permease
MPQPSNLRGIMAMVLAGITFVSCDSFLKLLVENDVPPLQALVLRGISATLWCLGLLIAMGQLRHLPKAFGFWTLMRAAAEVVAVTAFIIALANVPLADITAIYQAAPLIVLAGASLFWGERVGVLRWLLIGLGLAGALVVAQPGVSGSSPFALLGLVTALASAVRDLLSRKAPADAPGLVITFTVVVCVLAASTANTLLFETWMPVTWELAIYALGAGFFVTVAHFFVFMSFRLATARAVAPFYYTFTLIAAIFGAVFFNEWPNTLAIVGIAMIIACGLGVLLFEKRDMNA